jgi:thymidylate synthase (FAD)
MDDHAQEEIRAYATVIGEEITARWVPFVWEAFRDYRKDSVTLSMAETKIITLLVSGNRDAARDAAVQFGLLDRKSGGELRSSRERKELETKLALFGLKRFWE